MLVVCVYYEDLLSILRPAELQLGSHKTNNQEEETMKKKDHQEEESSRRATLGK